MTEPSAAGLGTRPGVSIVIPNYNYAGFVGAAIESALAQTHPLTEVIVVDDGSTDGSRAVIEGYGHRITAILQANAGQLAACAAGFARARHEIIIFLDSDDVLAPEAAATVARHWRPGLAKLQFRLETIDGDGRADGHLWPKYPPQLDPATARRRLLATGSYPSPPTSGNAYARRLLERAGRLEGHTFVDSVLNSIAPLYGDVLTIEDRLGFYRVHGSNNWAQDVMTAERFAYYAASERQRMAVLAAHCRKLGIAFAGPAVIERSIYYREIELVRAKLAARGWGLDAEVLRQTGRAVGVALAEPTSAWHRLLRALWSGAIGLVPRPLAIRLIAMRYVRGARPRLAERLINAFARRRLAGRGAA